MEATSSNTPKTGLLGSTRRQSRNRELDVLLYLDDSLLSQVVELAVEQGDGFGAVTTLREREEAVSAVRDEATAIVVIDADSGDRDDAADTIAYFAGLGEDVRVIALTGTPDPSYIAALLQAGATSCISKTVQSDDLGAVIRQAGRGAIYRSPMPIANRTVPRRGDSPLTRRELEILNLVAEGAGNKQIARSLWVTEQTVKFHLSNIFRKLGVSNRTAAGRVAESRGLIQRGDGMVEVEELVARG